MTLHYLQTHLLCYLEVSCPCALDCLILNFQGSYRAERNRLKTLLIIPRVVFHYRGFRFDFMKTHKLGVHLKLICHFYLVSLVLIITTLFI